MILDRKIFWMKTFFLVDKFLFSQKKFRLKNVQDEQNCLTKKNILGQQSFWSILFVKTVFGQKIFWGSKKDRTWGHGKVPGEHLTNKMMKD